MLPIQANATNTVAIWPGQVTSVAAYRPLIYRHRRLAVPLGFAGFVGGTAGALVLLSTPQSVFMHLIPWLLFFAASVFALSGHISRWLERRKRDLPREARPPRRFMMFLITSVICFYIGYFGAGAGFLIITFLSLLGIQDMNEVNALKVVSTTIANGVAFLIFVVRGEVEWRYCLLAMVACAVGGYGSARMARRIPQPVLRGTVILLGFSMATYFFWKTR